MGLEAAVKAEQLSAGKGPREASPPATNHAPAALPA